MPHTLLAVWQNQYFELDPHDLFDCNNPASSVRDFITRDHLCGNSREIITYNAKSSLTSCAAALYFEPHVPVPQNCQTRVRVTPNSIFTHLKHNIWLYALSQTNPLLFMCPAAPMHRSGCTLKVVWSPSHEVAVPWPDRSNYRHSSTLTNMWKLRNESHPLHF